MDARQEKVIKENEQKTKSRRCKTSSESKANVADKKSNSQTEGEPEGEGKQEAAFNPDTGEINWDCPCLGGMAHGPW